MGAAMTHSRHNAETPAPANHLSAGRGVISLPSPSPSSSVGRHYVPHPPAPPPDPDSPYLFANGLRNALAIEAVDALIIYAIWRVLK